MGEFPDKEVKLWFAGAGAEDIFKHTTQLAEILESNAPSKLNWKYSNEPNEKHNTTSDLQDLYQLLRELSFPFRKEKIFTFELWRNYYFHYFLLTQS